MRTGGGAASRFVSLEENPLEIVRKESRGQVTVSSGCAFVSEEEGESLGAWPRGPRAPQGRFVCEEGEESSRAPDQSSGTPRAERRVHRPFVLHGLQDQSREHSRPARASVSWAERRGALAMVMLRVASTRLYGSW